MQYVLFSMCIDVLHIQDVTSVNTCSSYTYTGCVISSVYRCYTYTGCVLFYVRRCFWCKHTLITYICSMCHFPCVLMLYKYGMCPLLRAQMFLMQTHPHHVNMQYVSFSMSSFTCADVFDVNTSSSRTYAVCVIFHVYRCFTYTGCVVFYVRRWFMCKHFLITYIYRMCHFLCSWKFYIYRMSRL